MYSISARFGLGDPSWLDPAIAGSIFLLSVLIGLLFHRLLFPTINWFTNWTPSDLDGRIVRAVRGPATVAIFVLGAYLALTLPLDLDGSQQNVVDAVASLLAILLGVVAITSAVSILFSWYVSRLGSQHAERLDVRLLPVVRRLVMLAIYVLAGLMIMNQLGINISPLIAGLGLGGLAIALALQPTLSNLFAGTYVMTEGVISPGDYIELQGGPAGYVVEVSWRSVRIRTWTNNLVYTICTNP